MHSESKAPDLSEQLAKLGKLHTDGALSDEEFKALKARLILQASDSQERHGPFKSPADEREAKDEDDWSLRWQKRFGPLQMRRAVLARHGQFPTQATDRRTMIEIISELLNALLFGGLEVIVLGALAVRVFSRNTWVFAAVVGLVLAYIAWKVPRTRGVVGAVAVLIAVGIVVEMGLGVVNYFLIGAAKMR